METRKIETQRKTPKSLYVNLSTEKKEKSEEYVYETVRVRRGRRVVEMKRKVLIPKEPKKPRHDKAYISVHTKGHVTKKQTAYNAELERFKRLKDQREERLAELRTDDNAIVIGVGQTSVYRSMQETPKILMECSLPEYNLGDLFGTTQEKLYPKQRASRHNKAMVIPEDIQMEIDNGMQNENEYEMVKEATLYVKKVFYMMVKRGEPIGMTRECALVSLFYNNGIYPIQNIGRRAAKFEKAMESDPEFLARIKKEYDEENDKSRKRRLALEQYHALQANIELLEKVTDGHAYDKTRKVEPIRNRRHTYKVQSMIKSVPVDGEKDRKYVNIKRGIYDTYGSCEEELKRLQEQMKTLCLTRKEELKEELKKTMTKRYICRLGVTKEDLMDWRMYFTRKTEESNRDMMELMKEYQMEGDVTISQELVMKSLPEVRVDQINEMDGREITNVDKLTYQQRHEEMARDVFRRKIDEIKASKTIIFNQIEDMFEFEKIKGIFNAVAFTTVEDAVRSYMKLPHSSSYFDPLEAIIRTYNSISPDQYKSVRSQIVRILERVYFNEDVVEIGTAYVKESVVVDALLHQVEWASIAEQMQNGTIEATIDRVRDPIHTLALCRLMDEATTVHREDEGNSEDELPDDIIEY